MIKLELTEFKKALDSNLESRSVSGKVILDRFCVIDESSRRSPSYLDPNYSGFYYHLTKYVHPCSLLEIGFDLGLLSCTFLSACKSVNKRNALVCHQTCWCARDALPCVCCQRQGRNYLCCRDGDSHPIYRRCGGCDCPRCDVIFSRQRPR